MMKKTFSPWRTRDGLRNLLLTFWEPSFLGLSSRGGISAWVLRTMGPQDQRVPPISPLTSESLSRCPLIGPFQAHNPNLPLPHKSLF